MNGYRSQEYRNRLTVRRTSLFLPRTTAARVAACALVSVMIIIGAGIIGLSCAWRLGQRGIRVQIFDAKKAASDASWAAAGMLSPESEGVGELGLRSAKLWPEFAAELERESGIDIDYIPFEASEAIVDPRAVTRALLHVCRKLGAELHENAPVTEIGSDPTLIA